MPETDTTLANLANALDRVGEVLALGSKTHLPCSWRDFYSIELHMIHAEDHLEQVMITGEHEPDDEDHLANACCRLLFALELRERNRGREVPCPEPAKAKTKHAHETEAEDDDASGERNPTDG